MDARELRATLMGRRNFAEIITGAVVLVVAAGFLAYAVAHSGRGGVSGYPLFARFDRIDGLVVGADVRLAGVKVGTVTEAAVDPRSYVAIIKLSMRDDVRLPEDTSAEVTSDGLLGGKYIAIVPGGDTAMLAPGQIIKITQSSVSLEQLLGKFIFSVTDMVNAVKLQSPATAAPGSPSPGSPSPGAPAPVPAVPAEPETSRP